MIEWSGYHGNPFSLMYRRPGHVMLPFFLPPWLSLSLSLSLSLWISLGFRWMWTAGAHLSGPGEAFSTDWFPFDSLRVLWRGLIRRTAAAASGVPRVNPPTPTSPSLSLSLSLSLFLFRLSLSLSLPAHGHYQLINKQVRRAGNREDTSLEGRSPLLLRRGLAD